MTSIKLPESRNNFREVTERFTSRKLFLLSGSSYQVGMFKFVCSLISYQQIEICLESSFLQTIFHCLLITAY
ncbi:MAG: hypothetical protein U5N85_17195 [Arcicella sp.]|nr:hypothetical protein [Arcicella sp.]